MWCEVWTHLKMKFNLSQFDMSTITKKIVILLLLLLLLLVRVPLAQYPISFTSPKPPAYASTFPWCLHWCPCPTMTKVHPRISKSMMCWSWRRHGWGLVVQCIHVIWRKCHKEMLINYSPNISHMKNPACF